MFSVIVCSIKPDLLDSLDKSIARTIGCEYEMIPVDNRERRWPIAKVYNYGASLAKHPNLLFVHEDIEFLSQDWGRIIADKLSESDCGVIGFAGSTHKSQYISGWSSYVSVYTRENYHCIHRGKIGHRVLNRRSDFEQVICLDGCAQFVSKSVWERHPFDEENLQGFHCYDIDFTMQTALAGYRNYVVYSVDILHKSSGTYDDRWLDASFRIMRDKWNALCPVSLEKPDKIISNIIKEELVWWSFKLAWRYKSPHYHQLKEDWLSCRKTLKHLGRYIRYIFKYSRFQIT